MFVSFLAAMLQEKSLPYQPGSHTVIRKHRTDQAETVTPSEAKPSHRSAEYCMAVTVPSLLILIPNFLDTRGITRESSVLMNFFPDKMVRAYVGNYPYVLVEIGGNVMPMLYVQRYLYAGLMVVLALICWEVYRHRQVGG